MKLAVFEANGAQQVGIVSDGKILPVPGVSDMIPLIADFQTHATMLHDLAATGEGWLALDTVALCAPIKCPGKILAIGLNYADHIAESGREKPTQQMWFLKASS